MAVTFGPGGPFLRGDHPRRDGLNNVSGSHYRSVNHYASALLPSFLIEGDGFGRPEEAPGNSAIA